MQTILGVNSFASGRTYSNDRRFFPRIPLVCQIHSILGGSTMPPRHANRLATLRHGTAVLSSTIYAVFPAYAGGEATIPRVSPGSWHRSHRMGRHSMPRDAGVARRHRGGVLGGIRGPVSRVHTAPPFKSRRSRPAMP